jgi:hypothetical protein
MLDASCGLWYGRTRLAVYRSASRGSQLSLSIYFKGISRGRTVLNAQSRCCISGAFIAATSNPTTPTTYGINIGDKIQNFENNSWTILKNLA